MKPNKEHYLEYITEFFRNGGVARKDIVSQFIAKFQTTDRTFDRYWKIASQQYQESVQQLQKVRAEQLAIEAKESVKRDIADKFERMEIATKIARGIGRRVGSQVITPSDSERLAACRYLSQLEGDFDDDDGNKVPITISFDLTKYELKSDQM